MMLAVIVKTSCYIDCLWYLWRFFVTLVATFVLIKIRQAGVILILMFARAVFMIITIVLMDTEYVVKI